MENPKDRTETLSQGARLLMLFHQPEWMAAVEVEQELLRKCEQDLLRGVQRGESHEEYLNRQLISSGYRKAIYNIWRERDRLMKSAKEQDQENEEKEAQMKESL